jgi:hypothetical protein
MGRRQHDSDADDDFPNLLSTLPDPSTVLTLRFLSLIPFFSFSADTFPNRLSKLFVCPDCGSTGGTGNCKCDKT